MRDGVASPEVCYRVADHHYFRSTLFVQFQDFFVTAVPIIRISLLLAWDARSRSLIVFTQNFTYFLLVAVSVLLHTQVGGVNTIYHGIHRDTDLFLGQIVYSRNLLFL